MAPGYHLHINIFLFRVHVDHFMHICNKANHQYIIIFTVIHCRVSSITHDVIKNKHMARQLSSTRK